MREAANRAGIPSEQVDRFAANVLKATNAPIQSAEEIPATPSVDTGTAEPAEVPTSETADKRSENHPAQALQSSSTHSKLQKSGGILKTVLGDDHIPPGFDKWPGSKEGSKDSWGNNNGLPWWISPEDLNGPDAEYWRQELKRWRKMQKEERKEAQNGYKDMSDTKLWDAYEDAVARGDYDEALRILLELLRRAGNHMNQVARIMARINALFVKEFLAQHGPLVAVKDPPPPDPNDMQIGKDHELLGPASEDTWWTKFLRWLIKNHKEILDLIQEILNQMVEDKDLSEYEHKGSKDENGRPIFRILPDLKGALFSEFSRITAPADAVDVAMDGKMKHPEAPDGSAAPAKVSSKKVFFRGTTRAQWEEIQKGETPQSEFSTGGLTWVTSDKESAEAYSRREGDDQAIIIEYKPSANSKLEKLTDDPGDQRRQGKLSFEDVAKVYDFQGNVLYDATAADGLEAVGTSQKTSAEAPSNETLVTGTHSEVREVTPSSGKPSGVSFWATIQYQFARWVKRSPVLAAAGIVFPAAAARS